MSKGKKKKRKKNIQNNLNLPFKIYIYLYINPHKTLCTLIGKNVLILTYSAEKNLSLY